MAGYFGWSEYRPYVPARVRRAQALRKAKQLERGGRRLRPVEIDGRAIAATFWGKAWCDHIEAYSDFSNRLPRGRTYARNGSVIDLQLDKGSVEALVQGSDLYKVKISVAPLEGAKWRALQRDCAGKIDSVVELLTGKLSDAVMQVLCDRARGIFPSPAQLKMSCSCPDYASLCKHLAAVLYGVGNRLDEEPELLFVLRGVDQLELVAAAGGGAVLGDSPPGGPELESAALSEVFGIELDSGAAPKAQAKRARPTRKKAIAATAQSPAADVGAVVNIELGGVGSEDELIARLGELSSGLPEPIACGGSVALDQPVKLRFADGATVAIRRGLSPPGRGAPKALRALVERCEPAKFGEGKRTRFSLEVRDALQLNAAGGTFTVRGFDPERAGVLEQVRRQLGAGDDRPLSAELYAVNVYQEGGHFVPHKDTPRGADMLGSLVVCLPSRFTGGALVVERGHASRAFRWADDVAQQREPDTVHWAAFFGDVDHRVEQVWLGARVTLSYLLRRSGEARIEGPLPPAATLLREGLKQCLLNEAFLPKGGVLAFPCFHLYSHEAAFQRGRGALPLSKLKGRDAEVCEALRAAGLEATLEPYLFPSEGDEEWPLARYPTRAELARLSEELTSDELDEKLPVKRALGADLRWVLAPGTPAAAREDDEDDSAPRSPAVEHVLGCEYSGTGYFGNEGGYTDFYLAAALHVRVPPFAKRNGARAKTAKRHVTRGSKPTGVGGLVAGHAAQLKSLQGALNEVLRRVRRR